MERVYRKIEKFERALRKLKEAFSESFLEGLSEEILMEIRIKRFEYTFEALWQAAQAYLRERGLECGSPRSCFEGLLKEGLIAPEDEEVVVRMLRLRNTLVHICDEDTARDLYEEIWKGPYLECLERMASAFKNTLSEGG